MNTSINTKLLTQNKTDELITIIKKYCNLFKAFHMYDPALANEFRKKQEFFYNEKHKLKEFKHNHKKEDNNCCTNKMNHKSFIFYFYF